jgi:hypothetical protein
MTKNEDAFLEQMTRQYLVTWCDTVTRKPADPLVLDPEDPYVKHAMGRGTPWVSTRDKTHFRILAAGWAAAAAFLKR